ncbi:formation of crista junctions protein 1 [Scheffersomyces coipomensis]|uniref:formation of crista junctions protein 1 n=1 Tax=Scheffersomyces coipomensis TaxID=1788519 RepID=UPI00315D466A
MLRSYSINSFARSNALRTRNFSKMSRVLEVSKAPITPAPTPPKVVKKKGFSVFRLLFNTTILASVLYGSTLYVATKNEKVMDFVIDKQLPYYEEIIDFIEKGSIDDIKTGFENLQSKVFNFKVPTTDEIAKTGENIINATRKTVKHQTGYDSTTPAEQLQKPVAIESVKKDIEHLPLIKVNENVASSVDETIKNTIESFNSLIQSIDASHVGPAKANFIKAINDNISELTLKLDALTKKFEEELQSKLKSSQTELLSSYTKKELELTENLLHQFNREKSQLEKKLNQRLKQEVQATKEAISQAAVNAVSMVRIEQTKNFEKLIADKMNEERNGKLANLESLSSRLSELEAFAESFETQLVNNHNRSILQKSLATFKSVLFASEVDEKPKSLKPYIENLNDISFKTNDEVIDLALSELNHLLAKESSQSILTTSQLLSRWEQLTPELRSASLLPPNAGLLGHFASAIFSKLLLPVKGNKPDGKDIESVIARVENSLIKGDLDVAVEEVANLKGWSRKLADDWVIEGRKRLEAELLVNLIESELRLL